MARLTDRDRVLEQYANAGRLATRVDLHARFSTNPHGWHAWMFEQLGLRTGDVVLELGCGRGYLWRRNASRLPGDVRLVLSDLSEGMLREAGRSPGRPSTAMAFAVADAQ